MPLQSQVYINQPLGVPGTIARLNPVPQGKPFVTEGTAVKTGGFVFAGTDPETQVVGTKTGATEVSGFAVFERYQAPLNGVSALNGLTVNEGEEIFVALRGCYFAVSTTAAVKGQNVVVNPTTGVIQTLVITRSETVSGSAIEVTDNIPEGFIDTGWVVDTGASANAVCVIQRV